MRPRAPFSFWLALMLKRLQVVIGLTNIHPYHTSQIVEKQIYTVTNTNTSTAITCTATLESDTAETKTVASADDTTETNTNVTLLPATEIPIASSLEFFSGQKVVLQATDKLKVQTNKSGLSMDCTLSLMEIT